jgi:hypothetical protein
MSFQDIRFWFRSPNVQLGTYIAVLGTFLFVMIVITSHYSRVAAQEPVERPRPRFVEIYHEEKRDDVVNALDFEVIRDKETGQETVCVFSGTRSGCWLTGRVWK